MDGFSLFTSPIGLGHVTRDIAIADSLRRGRGDGLLANFVTGDGAAQLLRRLGWGVQDVYRPPRFAIKNGSLQRPARWLWSYYRYYRDCKRVSERILRDSHPGLVVSDEDFASLVLAQRRGIPTVLITDVLKTSFTGGAASLVERMMNRSMGEIVGRCDAVIMPENGPDTGNIRRVGPIVRETDHTRDELRERFGFDRTTIVVSVGGTDAGRFLIRESVDAVSRLGGDLDIVLVSGPSISDGPPNVRDLGFVPNMHELVFAADLVVSLAGRSTIDEADAYGTPGIFIPIRGHFEQEANARARGYSADDVCRLDELIPSKLEKGKGTEGTGRKGRPAGPRGADRAADIIREIAGRDAASPPPSKEA